MIPIFKDNLKKLRGDFEFTQEEMSKYLNMPRSTYAGYERGNREPDYAALLDIASKCSVTIDELLGVKQPGSFADDVKAIFIQSGYDIEADQEEIHKIIKHVLKIYREIKKGH